MTYAIGIVLAVLAVYLSIRLDAHKRSQKIEMAFQGRDELSSNQFYERYFAENEVPFDVVRGVREILEEQLGADMSRLIDEDDFSKNLRFLWDFDSMASVEVVCALEEMFSIKIEDDEAERTRTVRDIVNLVCRKTGASYA